MRHTFATLASQGSALLQDIQFTLGHSKISTTAEIYQHGNIESSGRALEQMKEIIAAEHRPNAAASTKFNAEALYRSTTLAVASGGCRQLSSMLLQKTENYNGINSGAGEETLTLDLFLGNSKEASLEVRVTEMAGALRASWRCWLVGSLSSELSSSPTK